MRDKGVKVTAEWVGDGTELIAEIPKGYAYTTVSDKISKALHQIQDTWEVARDKKKVTRIV